MRPTVILPLLLLAGCSTPAPPEVDVSGVWTGTWQGEGGLEHGHLVLDLRQAADGSVSGGIYLRYDLPSLTNVGVDLAGRVEGPTLSVTMQSTENPHTFHGETNGEAIAGAMEYRGLTGSWEARRLPTRALQIETCFDADMHRPRALTSVGKELWATDAVAFYRIDPSARRVEKLTPPPSAPSCQSGLTHDGSALLCSGGSPKVHRFDLALKDQGSFELSDKSWPELLAFDGKDLWVTAGATSSIRRVDLKGQVLATHTVKASLEEVTWLRGHLFLLLFTPRAVLELDPAGTIVAGYQLPPQLAQRSDADVPIPGGLAALGDALWIAVEHITPTSSGPSSSRVELCRLKLP